MSRKRSIADKCAIVIAVSVISIMLGASTSSGTTPPQGMPQQQMPQQQIQGQPPAGQDNNQVNTAAEDAQRLEEHKQQMLKQIGDRIAEMQSRIAEMQKKQACVQAAADREALRACFPGGSGNGPRGDGEHHRGFGGPGGQDSQEQDGGPPPQQQ